MAGIGLTLRRLLADQSFLSSAAAYFSSGVISAGPWLISMISLTLLQGEVTSFLPSESRALLFATITYVFVGSSILTGPVQIVLTRIVADQIFLRETESIARTFTDTLTASLLVIAATAIPFLAWAPFDPTYRLLTASLFLIVSAIWLVLGAVSAAQDFLSIAFAFLLGYAASGSLAIWVGHQYGLTGALAGFCMGQAICLATLCHRIYAEFPEGAPGATDVGGLWREYWSLALIGLLYSLGLWAEKIIYWFSPAATSIAGFYRVYPPYDSAILLAYLLTIPASAVFLVNIETDFYQHYRAFYSHILRKRGKDGSSAQGGTFDQIDRARRSMLASVWSGFWTLTKIQGIIAVLALLLAADLGQYLGLTAEHVGILRIAILAASGQEFVLYGVLMLLYLDARMQTLALVSIFAASNIGLSLLLARLAPGTYGAGYLFSTIIAASFGLYQLEARLSKLDYITFMLQPLEPGRERSGAAGQNNRLNTPK